MGEWQHSLEELVIIIKRAIITIALFVAFGTAFAENVATYDYLKRKTMQCGLPPIYAALPWVLTQNDNNFSDNNVAGAWALSATAAARNGLVVTSMCDERKDFEHASTAAINYLAKLYSHCRKDNQRVLSIYLKAMYVNDASIKANAVLAQLNTLTNKPTSAMLQHRTELLEEINVDKSLSVDLLCKTLDCSSDEFFAINPAYSDKLKVVEAESRFRLTADMKSRFVLSEEEMYNKAAVELVIQNPEPSMPAIAEAPVAAPTKPNYIVYRVKQGDTLSKIAVKYKVSVKQLMKWNKLTNANKLSLGQKIKIYR